MNDKPKCITNNYDLCIIYTYKLYIKCLFVYYISKVIIELVFFRIKIYS